MWMWRVPFSWTLKIVDHVHTEMQVVLRVGSAVVLQFVCLFFLVIAEVQESSAPSLLVSLAPSLLVALAPFLHC